MSRPGRAHPAKGLAGSTPARGTVYVVMFAYDMVSGVFSTLEKARAFVASEAKEGNPVEYHAIHGWAIDDPEADLPEWKP